MELWNAGSTPELVRIIQEQSDDIEKVTIPQHPYIVMQPGGQEVEAGLVIHLVSGRLRIIPNKTDAEAVLNDGIFNRMKIKIELGR